MPDVNVRQCAMNDIYRVLKPGGRFVFTTHCMDDPTFAAYWEVERERWGKGLQDVRLLEYGDRIFSKPEAYGDVLSFVHIPVKGEIESCIERSGFKLIYSKKRSDICEESAAILDFSVDVTFWVCEK